MASKEPELKKEGDVRHDKLKSDSKKKPDEVGGQERTKVSSLDIVLHQFSSFRSSLFYHIILLFGSYLILCQASLHVPFLP